MTGIDGHGPPPIEEIRELLFRLTMALDADSGNGQVWWDRWPETTRAMKRVTEWLNAIDPPVADDGSPEEMAPDQSLPTEADHACKA